MKEDCANVLSRLKRVLGTESQRVYQKRALPFASDASPQTRYRKEFPQWGSLFFPAILIAEISRILAPQKNRDFFGSGQIAAASAEVRAILVHSRNRSQVGNH